MMKLQLQVLLGKQAGKQLNFSAGEFVFGRGPECHVRPNSELVSRQHCLVAVRDDVITIRDLGSINGTLVNGCRVRDELALHDGDHIQMGPLAFLVKVPIENINGDTLADAPICQAGTTLHDDSLIQPDSSPRFLGVSETVSGDLFGSKCQQVVKS